MVKSDNKKFQETLSVLNSSKILSSLQNPPMIEMLEFTKEYKKTYNDFKSKFGKEPSWQLNVLVKAGLLEKEFGKGVQAIGYTITSKGLEAIKAIEIIQDQLERGVNP